MDEWRRAETAVRRCCACGFVCPTSWNQTERSASASTLGGLIESMGRIWVFLTDIKPEFGLDMRTEKQEFCLETAGKRKLIRASNGQETIERSRDVGLLEGSNVKRCLRRSIVTGGNDSENSPFSFVALSFSGRFVQGVAICSASVQVSRYRQDITYKPSWLVI